MADLEALFHHIVLPPRLPTSRDENPFVVGKDLLRRLVQACGTLRAANASNPHAAACNDLVAALGQWSSVYGDNIDKARYYTALKTLLDSDKDKQVLAMYVVEQNAALLVYRNDENVVFEAFEAAPQSQDVLAARNALVCKFPSQAAQIPKATLADDEGLQRALASFLSKATCEHLSRFSATVEKAGISVGESRNPGSPALITHMLMAVIGVLGSAAAVPVLKKRVRDDVNFRSGSGGTDPDHGPWRRNPFWLILRVAVRRHLQLVFGPEAGRGAYKLLLSMMAANLLRDAVSQRQKVTTVDLILKKLGRRLAKLEKLPRAEGTPWSLDVQGIRSVFEQVVQSANDYIQTEFDSFKRTFKRNIPRIVPRLDPSHPHLRLSLPNSLEFLQELSERYRQCDLPVASHQSDDLDSKLAENPGIAQERSMYKEVATLSGIMHTALYDAAEKGMATDTSLEDKCQDMCIILDDFLQSLPSLATKNLDPEQNSQICLAAFRIWMDIDKLATQCHPLLLEYRPPFPPDLLDTLQLIFPDDIREARAIQEYLRVRHLEAVIHDVNIYGLYGPRCFGTRSAQSSPHLMNVLRAIRQIEKQAREEKKTEWEHLCERYNQLTAEIKTLPCICTDTDEDGKLWHDCEQFYLKRQRWKLKLAVCEDLLPADDSLAAAVLFELYVPSDFSAYRNSTWMLLRKLAYPTQPASYGKIIPLSDNKSLQAVAHDAPIFTNKSPGSICIASVTKNFSQTHYGVQRMWIEYEDLLVGCASTVSIYDAALNIRTSDFNLPLTLAHLCGISTPSPLIEKFPRLEHPPTYPDGPSSYQAVANRLQCPADLAQHEFEAYHYLLGGRARRWLTLLAELGSANLNFSKDDTLLTCTHLVHQIGPASLPASNERGATDHAWELGTCHAVFADDCFVSRLLAECEKRLEAIRGSWRESNCMDLVITLSFAIYTHSTNAAYRQKAHKLIQSVRASVLQWVMLLRKEATTSAEASASAFKYCFRAALLGRRTFHLFAFDACSSTDDNNMQPGDISDFLTLSIALQQSRVVDMTRLSRMDIVMLRRDSALSVELEDLVIDAATMYPEAVGKAVADSIGMGIDTVKSFTPQEVHRDHHRGWMTATISTVSGLQQVDLDCLGGHILVDGKTLQKMPDDIRDSKDVQELFDKQHLLTYPSHIPGAVCRLAAEVEGFSVHFGRYNGDAVIIAESVCNKSLSYFVPRRVFMDSLNETYDLPRELVDDCVHWYDRDTGLIEITRKPDIWTSKKNNWRINVATQQAWRKNSLLLDPQSFTGKIVSAIFNNFEDARRLTVYQPTEMRDDGKMPTLKIDLRHLDLSFSVSGQGLLMCQQLGAEIDPDQDAGTLYGYESMIVMRKLDDYSQRSIIAPLGPLITVHKSPHISLRTNTANARDSRRYHKYTVSAKDKAYVRYTIDPVLGRLVSPQEPLLLYTKAQLHAYTSFSPLPDPLTGRTGSEEAMEVLSSGLCQPWEPLDKESKTVLLSIRDLCTKRTYYPSDKRMLQQVYWAASLPIGTQNDRYKDLVDSILYQSEALKPFHGQSPEEGQDQHSRANIANKSREDATDHLHARAKCQHLRFEPPHASTARESLDSDIRYRSRGQSARIRVDGVQEVARMLTAKGDVFVEQDLSAVLSRWDRIGGYDKLHESITDMPLSELTSSRTISERWGVLARLCVEARSPEQTGDMLMTLCVMSFSPAIDMDALRWLVAFFRNTALKSVLYPAFPVYAGFQFNETPSQATMSSLVAQAYPAIVYMKDDMSDVHEEREKHRVACQQNSSALAQKILSIWPDQLDDVALARMLLELPESNPLRDEFVGLDKIRPELDRLHHNYQLSRYVAKVEGIMRKQGLLNYCAPVADQTQMECLGRDNGRPRRYSKDSDSLGRPENPTENVALLLGDGLARQDMQWKPLPTNAIPAKPTPNHTSSSAAVLYKPGKDVLGLACLIRDFSDFAKRRENTHRAQYSSDLKNSLDALKRFQVQQLQQQQHSQQATSHSVKTLPSLTQARHQESRASEATSCLYNEICTNFTQSDTGAWLRKAGLWPRLTPTAILELLRSTTPPAVWGKNVREKLVEYGCALTSYQQHRRIRRAVSRKDTRRAWDEVRNHGHSNWNPIDHTDWLLLEVDCDMLIRAHQLSVAHALLAPASNANAVLQLNMGQGKTSCIVPMAMAALADGQQLARLIVPKTLLPVTAQTVQARLGGLVGRQVRHLAFSRRLLSHPNIDRLVSLYEDHHNDLIQRRGILLSAPEHLLAFKLSGLQCLVDCHEDGQKDIAQSQPQPQGQMQRTQQQDKKQQKRLHLAQRMMSFQDRLANELCRDVLDESDVILSSRTQLVYPSGAQTVVDGAPQRWVLAQVLLTIVEDQLPRLCLQFPKSISSAARGADGKGGRGFPMVQILQASQIQEPLHAAIIETLSGGQSMAFGAWGAEATAMTASQKQHLLRLALETDKDGTVSNLVAIETAASLFADSRAARDGLLLVHGLLANRVLLVCLCKRWNVQYGLHPKRWPIAVPYEAKGVPSERSEFGHPDVSIILTCLAFYYSGLTRQQLRDGLRHILCHHDDPATAYGHWMAGGVTSLPAELQQWNVVNLDDDNQVEQLWKYLRLTRPVIDHYLNTLVFPVHARQFSMKLQASAWDVPLGKNKKTRKNDNRSKARTTGFSGTNDNRAMLPLNIEQLDLDFLKHTNAEVLTYLLQERNCEYQCCMNQVHSQPWTHSGFSGFSGFFQKSSHVPATQTRWTEVNLLENLKLKGIRVLIDAGAYILEQDNKSLARAWLQVDHDAEAAIFFDESDNRAWVLFRDVTAGSLPLVATPFVDERRLEKCLVYFDEAHTRGVDLPLPPHCRGGITLALGQTKDQTMQAAMRLRQLGTTQSVLWYAPPEVDRSIRHVWASVTEKPVSDPNTRLESKHVILWLLEQTCAASEQLQPLYLSQGYDFCQRLLAEKRFRQYTKPETGILTNGDGDDDGDGVYQDDWSLAVVGNNRKERKLLVDALQQPERMSLDQLYGTAGTQKENVSGLGVDERKETGAKKESLQVAKAERSRNLSTLAQMFQQLQARGLDRSRSNINQAKLANAAFEEVEQEREVEVQVEQVRANRAQVHFDALNFPGHLHWAIVSFLRSRGTLPQNHGFRQVFASISRSEVGKRHGVRAAGTASQLYVSTEFERTIRENKKPEANGNGNGNGSGKKGTKQGRTVQAELLPTAEPTCLDQFYRPVQWLLWNRRTETALVVVPEEAELLLQILRRSQHGGDKAPSIHLLLYSAAVTRAMVELSSGTYYAVPPFPADYSLPSWLTIEVGILGGRLYMSFSESEAMRAYLKENSAVSVEDGGVNVANGASGTKSTTTTAVCSNLSSFLLDWLPLRRPGQDISHTPAAYVCQGRHLHEGHSFFVQK